MSVENLTPIDCRFCGTSYEIVYECDKTPEYCVFCGEIVEVEEKDDDNWDN